MTTINLPPARTRVFEALTRTAVEMGLPPPIMRPLNDRGDGYIEVPVGGARIEKRVFYNLSLLIRYDQHGRLWRHVRLVDVTPSSFLELDGNWRNEVFKHLHPHLDRSGNVLCQDGDKLIQLWRALESEDWDGFYTLLVLLAATFNPKSPYHRPPGVLPCWHEGCDNGGDHYCMSCRLKAACDEHRQNCLFCSEPSPVCPDCAIESRQTPGRFYHRGHGVMECSRCGNESGNTHTCASCRQGFCRTCRNETTAGNNSYCVYCAGWTCSPACQQHGWCASCLERVRITPGAFSCRRCSNGDSCRNGPRYLPSSFFANRSARECLDCVANPPEQMALPLDEAAAAIANPPPEPESGPVVVVSRVARSPQTVARAMAQDAATIMEVPR